MDHTPHHGALHKLGKADTIPPVWEAIRTTHGAIDATLTAFNALITMCEREQLDTADLHRLRDVLAPMRDDLTRYRDQLHYGLTQLTPRPGADHS